MRLSTLLTCLYLSSSLETTMGYSKRPRRTKLSDDADTYLMEHHIREMKALREESLRRLGIVENPDYERLRRLVDVSQPEKLKKRRILQRQSSSENELATGGKESLEDENMEFWGRFLNWEESTSMAPFSSPSSSPTSVPLIAPSATTPSPMFVPPTNPPSVPTPTPVEIPVTSPPSAHETLEPTAVPLTASPIQVTPLPTTIPVTTMPLSENPTGSPVAIPSPTMLPLSPSSFPTPSGTAPLTTPAPQATPATPSPIITPATPSPIITPATPSPIITPATPSPSRTPSTPSPIITPAPMGLSFMPTGAPVRLTPVPATPSPVVTFAPVRYTSLPTLTPIYAPVPEYPTIEKVLRPVALEGGVEFERDDYQRDALDSLESDGYTSSLSPDRIIQRYALACIYHATFAVSTDFTDALYGPGVVLPWTKSDGWLTPSDECTWFGLGCRNTFIVNITLLNNELSGEWPNEFSLLSSSLEILVLNNNLVFSIGNRMNFYLGLMTELQVLQYSNTNFVNTNGVPPEIGQLTNLRMYVCSNVRYVGALDGAAFPPSLEFLSIEDNSFQSSLPSEIGTLNLQFLYVGNCLLTGDISSLQNMPNLIELWVDDNTAFGNGGLNPIPEGVAANPSLISFSGINNGWGGTLPSSFANKLNTVFLWFNDNLITGPIPESYGNLQSLQIFLIYNNQITGFIPSGLCSNVASGVLNITADCANCQSGCCTDCIGG